MYGSKDFVPVHAYWLAVRQSGWLAGIQFDRIQFLAKNLVSPFRFSHISMYKLWARCFLIQHTNTTEERKKYQQQTEFPHYPDCVPICLASENKIHLSFGALERNEVWKSDSHIPNHICELNCYDLHCSWSKDERKLWKLGMHIIKTNSSAFHIWHCRWHTHIHIHITYTQCDTIF